MKHPLLYDCTIREGEQSAITSYDLKDRLEIAELLVSLNIDYIEGPWLVSEDTEGLKFYHELNKIKNLTKTVTFVGMTSDNVETNRRIRVATKTNTDFCTLLTSLYLPSIHRNFSNSITDYLKKIQKHVLYLQQYFSGVFIDVEHFFDSFVTYKEFSSEFLFFMNEVVKPQKIVLCDTRGGTKPNTIIKITKSLLRNFCFPVGIHLHNDIACADTTAILLSDNHIDHIQGTINGIGERVGNTNLINLIPYFIKNFNSVRYNQQKLKQVSEKIAMISNVRLSLNAPYVGKTAFCHKAGLHIKQFLEIDSKAYEIFNPFDIGNTRGFLISNLSGENTKNLIYRNIQDSKLLAVLKLFEKNITTMNASIIIHDDMIIFCSKKNIFKSKKFKIIYLTIRFDKKTKLFYSKIHYCIDGINIIVKATSHKFILTVSKNIYYFYVKILHKNLDVKLKYTNKWIYLFTDSKKFQLSHSSDMLFSIKQLICFFDKFHMKCP